MSLLHRYLVSLLAMLPLASLPTLAAPPDLESLLQQGDFDAAARLTRQQPEHPLAKLLELARKKNLASKPEWLTLVHYRKGATGRYTSEIDAPYFFLSESGKTNPEKELQATLAAFFSARPKKPMRLTPYCRFVARRHWLFSELGLPAQAIPAQECPEYERYLAFLNPEQLTIVFPAAHPNSPSSAFGHTLLRIDHHEQTAETRMLNMSLNFAAEIPEGTDPLSYALLGLGGGFKGKFTMLPYHIKLREYGQIDNRDVWEFPLQLTQEEVDAIMRHSYEMLIVYYDYYFFKENCAYHLLSLLDVVSPEDRFTDHYSGWTIPVDTVRLLEQKGLIRSSDFYPSTSRSIQHRIAMLDAEDLTLVKRGIDGGTGSIHQDLDQRSEETRVQLLDIINDYQRYLRFNNKEGSPTRLSPAEKETLLARSKIRIKSVEPDIKAPSLPPQQGHATGRIAVGMEKGNSLDSLYSIQYRPAYHNLLDPTPGYGDNSAIDFFAISAAVNEDGDDVFLKEFTLLDIQSLEPRDELFKPISWRTRISWQREYGRNRTRFSGLGAAGLSYRPRTNGPLAYGFLEGSYLHDRALDKQDTLLGDIRLGLLWEPHLGMKFNAEVVQGWDIVNQQPEWRQQLRGNISLSNAFSFELGASRIKQAPLPAYSFWSATLKFYH